MTLARMFALGLALTVVVAESARAVSSTTAAPDAIQFVPQGSVKRVRQATARFPTSMVALGDPRAPPIRSRSTAPRRHRRAGSTAAPGPTTSRATCRPGCAAASRCAPACARSTARAIARPAPVFAFDTGGPAIRAHRAVRGLRARSRRTRRSSSRSTPSVDAASIEAHVGFEVDGHPRAHRRRASSTGAEHDAILDDRAELRDDEPHVVVRARAGASRTARASTLVWGPGVATTTGVATDRRAAARVQVARRRSPRPFAACARSATPPAIPLGAMRVDFSAPVARRSAEGVTLVARRRRAAPARQGRRRRRPRDRASPSPVPSPRTRASASSCRPGSRDEAGRAPSNAGRYPLTVATGELPAAREVQRRASASSSRRPTRRCR